MPGIIFTRFDFSGHLTEGWGGSVEQDVTSQLQEDIGGEMWMNAVWVCRDKRRAFAWWWTTTHRAGMVPEPGCGCVLVTCSVISARPWTRGLRGSIRQGWVLERASLGKVPEKYSDNLQICSVLVLSKMSKISCYFENGSLISSSSNSFFLYGRMMMFTQLRKTALKA